MQTSTQIHRQSLVGRLIWVVAGLACLAITCTRQAQGPDRSADAPAPATAATTTQTPPPAQAAAASCLSCHENLETEMISRVHGRHDIACTDCHGASVAHAAGGSPPPQPDHTFAGAAIEKKCTECHEHHSQRMLERAVARRTGRKSPHGEPITISSTCTDCHGRHVRPD